MMESYSSIEEIRAANRAAGQYFFHEAKLRYFDSRVLAKVYGGRYFVTSEQHHRFDGSSEPRRYTVREVEHCGHVYTVGEFQGYATASEAARAAQELANASEAARAAQELANADTVKALGLEQIRGTLAGGRA
jgi:uncharacterized protein (DUF1330 family)